MYLVRKRVSFVNTPEIDHFHYHMFHGLEKEGALTKVWLNTSQHIPIRQPNLDWIVMREVADRLSKLEGIMLDKCHIVDTIKVAFAPGNFSHWDDPKLRGYASSDDPSQIYQDRKFISRSACDLNVFKVRCASLEDVAGKKQQAMATMVSAKEVGLSIEESLYVSKSVWDVAELLFYGAAYVVRDQLFEQIREFLPPPYYYYHHKNELE